MQLLEAVLVGGLCVCRLVDPSGVFPFGMTQRAQLAALGAAEPASRLQLLEALPAVNRAGGAGFREWDMA